MGNGKRKAFPSEGNACVRLQRERMVRESRIILGKSTVFPAERLNEMRVSFFIFGVFGVNADVTPIALKFVSMAGTSQTERYTLGFAYGIFS